MTHRVLTALAAAMILAAPGALAHGGGKDSYGGHTDKATGLYHCHTKQAPPAKAELCDLIAKGKNAGAVVVRARAAQDAANEAKAELAITKRELRDALAENDAVLANAKAMVERARSGAATVKARYSALMSHAEADREAAGALRREARERLAEAIERERGAGPSSNRTCRETLRKHVINASRGWLSGDVRVDEEARGEIDAACLR